MSCTVRAIDGEPEPGTAAGILRRVEWSTLSRGPRTPPGPNRRQTAVRLVVRGELDPRRPALRNTREDREARIAGALGQRLARLVRPAPDADDDRAAGRRRVHGVGRRFTSVCWSSCARPEISGSEGNMSVRAWTLRNASWARSSNARGQCERIDRHQGPHGGARSPVRLDDAVQALELPGHACGDFRSAPRRRSTST